MPPSPLASHFRYVFTHSHSARISWHPIFTWLSSWSPKSKFALGRLQKNQRGKLFPEKARPLPNPPLVWAIFRKQILWKSLLGNRTVTVCQILRRTEKELPPTSRAVWSIWMYDQLAILTIICSTTKQSQATWHCNGTCFLSLTPYIANNATQSLHEFVRERVWVILPACSSSRGGGWAWDCLTANGLTALASIEVTQTGSSAL